jgi:hypothetical protein
MCVPLTVSPNSRREPWTLALCNWTSSVRLTKPDRTHGSGPSSDERERARETRGATLTRAWCVVLARRRASLPAAAWKNRAQFGAVRRAGETDADGLGGYRETVVQRSWAQENDGIE